MLLSPSDDARTLLMAQPVNNDKRNHAGKATPTSMGQYRYTTMERLEKSPARTSELRL